MLSPAVKHYDIRQSFSSSPKTWSDSTLSTSELPDILKVKNYFNFLFRLKIKSSFALDTVGIMWYTIGAVREDASTTTTGAEVITQRVGRFGTPAPEISVAGSYGDGCTIYTIR